MRAPTIRDFVYSSKTFLAAAISLAIGFSDNLENPYWSALTCYVIVNPPGAGAIRSKALFRLGGNVIGGIIVLLLTGLFGDQLGVLGAAYIMVLSTFAYLYHIDRTPLNYLYFAVCITTGVVGLSNLLHPEKIAAVTAARVGEITIGILVMAIVDGLIMPEPQTPGFLKDMAEWEGKARDWFLRAVHPAERDDARRRQLRAALRELIAAISTIDAKAVQLPFDPGPRPPRGHHLDLLRREVTLLVGDLAELELWMPDEARHDATKSLADAAADWVRAGPNTKSASHAAAGERLAERIEVVRDALDAGGGRATLLERGFLSRLASAVRHWGDLSLVLHAVGSGRSLPPRLEMAAKDSKPVRSVDYLAAALDLLPMVSVMIFTMVFWYLTAWSTAPAALLLGFIGTLFFIGMPIGKVAGGLLVGFVIAFCFVFVYQFAILPRVTTFETLVIALGCIMIPLGVLMAQNMLGLIASAMIFSMLGLQDAYHADITQDLQTLLGSAVGLLFAAVFLSLGSYDREALTSRRLAAAARRDNCDLSALPGLPPNGRFLSLALYRLSLYFPAAEKAAGGKPLPHLRLLSDFGIGSNLLALRRHEHDASPGAGAVIRDVRAGVAEHCRTAPGTRDGDDRLRTLVAASLDNPAVVSDRAYASLRDALLGLDLALTEIPRQAAA